MSTQAKVNSKYQVGDKVFVIDWGKHYSSITRWNEESRKRENIFPWKTEVPNYCGINYHWSHEYEDNLTLEGTINKKEPKILVSKTPVYKDYKWEILEIIYHPEAGQYHYTEEQRTTNGWGDSKYTESPIYLLASTHTDKDWMKCYVQIEEEGLSFITPEQYADEKFNALREFHKGKYTIEDRDKLEVKGFPKELIKSVYDENDNVLFGSSYVKGKVYYNYIEGYFTKDGIPFIVSVGINYDGKGNSDLPDDALVMSYYELPKMFPNNKFS
jgi:hypothetical protein